MPRFAASPLRPGVVVPGKPHDAPAVVYRVLSEAQQDAIRERLRFGETIPAVAAAYRTSVKSVVEIAKGVVRDPEIVVGGRFNRQARVTLIDELADAIWAALHPGEGDKKPTAVDLRNLAVAAGVAIDKRRLEAGLATSHSEQHTITSTAPKKVWSRRALPKG